MLVLGALVASARYTGSSLWDKFVMWDASWYVAIAEKGYPKVDAYLTNFDLGNVAAHPAFFPLSPATVRWTSWLTGLSPVTTAAALSTVFGAVAACLLWLLARRLTDEAAGTRAVVLFVFFPGALVGADAVVAAAGGAGHLHRQLIGLALTAQTLGARPSFVLAAFPLILAVARVTTGWRHQALVGASAGLLAVVTVVYAAVDGALGVP